MYSRLSRSYEKRNVDKIKKLLRKVSSHDRDRLENTVRKIFRRDHTGIDCRKLKGYEHIYRVRVGNYRIMYYDDGKEIILKAVKRRDESTYSKF